MLATAEAIYSELTVSNVLAFVAQVYYIPGGDGGNSPLTTPGAVPLQASDLNAVAADNYLDDYDACFVSRAFPAATWLPLTRRHRLLKACLLGNARS